MAVKLKWYGNELMALNKDKIAAAMHAWWVELQRLSREAAGVMNEGVPVAITRPRAGGNKTSRTVYQHSSRPGEPPRRRTGFGQDNIVGGFDRARMAARVGYTRAARYMTYHELGIRYPSGTQQRPTIIPAERDNRQRLVQLMKRAADSVT